MFTRWLACTYFSIFFYIYCLIPLYTAVCGGIWLLARCRRGGMTSPSDSKLIFDRQVGVVLVWMIATWPYQAAVAVPHIDLKLYQELQGSFENWDFIPSFKSAKNAKVGDANALVGFGAGTSCHTCLRWLSQDTFWYGLINILWNCRCSRFDMLMTLQEWAWSRFIFELVAAFSPRAPTLVPLGSQHQLTFILKLLKF